MIRVRDAVQAGALGELSGFRQEFYRCLVGGDNSVTSRDLGILVDRAAEPVASSDADGVARGRGRDLAVGCSLTEGPGAAGGCCRDRRIR